MAFWINIYGYFYPFSTSFLSNSWHICGFWEIWNRLKMAKISQKKFQGPIFRDIDKCLKNRWISSMIWNNFLLMLYLGHSLKSTLEIVQWNLMKMMWGICLMNMESPLLTSVLNKPSRIKCKFVLLLISFTRKCPLRRPS